MAGLLVAVDPSGVVDVLATACGGVLSCGHDVATECGGLLGFGSADAELSIGGFEKKV